MTAIQKSRFATNAPFAPMMAPQLKSFRDIVYPVLVHPRVKGERCIIRNGTPLTKRLTPVPNRMVQEQLSGLPDFDGMLQVVYSGTDEMYGNHLVHEPNAKIKFVFSVFDMVDTSLGYRKRLEEVSKWSSTVDSNVASMYVVVPQEVHTKTELQAVGEKWADAGYIDMVISDPDAPYYHGLCPYNSGIRYIWNMERV
jgi:hypothetical protein